MDELQALRNALQRERLARKEAEKILEDKSRELFDLNQQLLNLNQKLSHDVDERTKEIELLSRFPMENSAPVIRVNQNQEIIFYNPGAEFLIENIYIDLELKNQVFEVIQEVLSSTNKEIEVEREFTVAHKTYTLRFISIDDHNYVNIYGTDISVQKKVLRSLEKSEILYKQLVESASDIIYRCNLKGDFVYVNPIGIRIAGLKEEEIFEMNFIDLVHEDHKERVRIFYEEQFSSNQTNSTYLEFPIVIRNGDIRWIGQSAQSILTENGKFIHEFAAVARDITERKKIEFDLIEAREKAEDSMKAKEQFLANMSHEIRTPIHVILGMARLVKQKSQLNSEQKRYVEAILKSGENLSVIINDILDFSKIEAGKLELEDIHFDLEESINSVVTLLKLKAEEKDLLLETVIDSEIHNYYNSDPHRLNQILLNLVNNALKFTEKGKVKIQVELSKKVDNIEYVKFSVEDTGIGISKENLKKIFQDFSQVDKSDTRKYGGTGLGLSISKRITHLLGGKMIVESKLGVGTCFSFILPLEVVNYNLHSKDSENSVKLENFKNLSVLLVEDNPYNQLLAETIFKDIGIFTTIANHGQEAIDLLKQHNDYDLIFMDIQMPVMNGIETTHYLRNRLNITIPIVALTANALKGDKDKYIKEGMDSYLSKPFVKQDLFNILTELLPSRTHVNSDENEKQIETNESEEKEYNSLIQENINEEIVIASSDDKLYDFGYLKGMGVQDESFIPQMIQTYFKSVPSTLEKMEVKYLEEDCVEIGLLAHRLVGACRTFKMDKIVQSLEALEYAGESNDWKTIQKEYPVVTSLFKKVAIQLKREIE